MVIDAEIEGKDLSFKSVDQVDQIRPYGMKNERPTFLLSGVSIHSLNGVDTTKITCLGKSELIKTSSSLLAFQWAIKLEKYQILAEMLSVM